MKFKGAKHCKFTDTEKWCPTCTTWLCHSSFGVNRANAGNLASICKRCKQQRDKLRDRTRATTGLPPQSEITRDKKKAYRQNLRKRVISFLGGRCCSSKCLVVDGCVDERCLQIDHVNGGGSKEYKALNHQSTFYNKVLKDTSNSYQLLCANCNWIKRCENQEVPH